MRKLVLASLTIAALLAAPACKSEDPNAFETHVKKLDDPETRGMAMGQLERLSKGVVSNDEETRKKEFAEKVLPKFAELWDEAPESRLAMLEMARDVGRPEGAVLFNKAIVLDGSSEGHKAAVLALQGIREADATDSVDAIIGELKKTIKDPSKDKGELEGQIRLEYVKTLGALGDKKAVPVLVETLAVDPEEQPVAIHREAIKALGDLGDPAAVDPLLTATLRVPDANSTTDVFNRSMLALVAIGDPAVDGALKMFRGENAEAQALAAEQGLDDKAIKMITSQFLGALHDSKATEDLVAFMPKDDCAEDAEVDAEAGALRAQIARQLGFIGDEAASEALCTCSLASKNVGDMEEIAQALGWIGGDKAVECLSTVVQEAEYSLDSVANSEFQKELRWEGARFLILAAGPKHVDQVKAALDAAKKDEQVAKKIEEAGFEEGLGVLEKCKDDKACYLETLNDANANWFAREKAAVEVARLGKGNVDDAVAVSKAFKVRNPVARVTVALLVPQMLPDKKCQACVEAFEGVLEAEMGSMDREYQLSVIKARHAIAALEDHSAKKAAAAGGGDAKAEDAKAE